MIVDGSLFNQLYETVRIEKHESEDKSILVFVANSDVDAICAVKQLQEILKSDEAHFSQNPVESYNQIRDACVNIKDTTELRTIFLINCGATEDVRSMCGFQDNPNIRLVIIDSHRPIWHGYNDSNTDTLVLLDSDDPVPQIEIPEVQPGDGALREGNTAAYYQETGEVEYSDEEQGEEEEAGPSGRRSPKRRRKGFSKEANERREELLAYYSEKSGYGKPSAILLYQLAHTLRMSNTHSLWLGILGLTDQLVHQRINRLDYDKWRKWMELQLQQHGGHLQDLTNTSQRHDSLAVAKVTDLRLSLLRHWSLLEALTFSSYTASRMNTWTEKGKQNVKLLLAKMNVPLDQSEATFCNMAPKYRESLPKQLEQHGVDFGLNIRSLMVEGFELRYKSDVRLSATDMVMMITTALGKPRQGEEDAKMGFHEASALLDVERNMPDIKSSMERVKHVSRAIVQQGGLAITRRQVQNASKFWHLDMSELDFANKQDFQHPTTLQHLALFIRDAMCRRVHIAKAIVIVGPPDKDNRCYVVALRPKEIAGTMQNNPFARPFEEVIESLGTRTHGSMFDSSLYHISRADAGGFLEELKIIVQRSYTEAAGTAA